MAKNQREIEKIRLFDSLSDNPWYNLAFEEYLLDQVDEGEVILYLWQNRDTVVIGRNQNAWKECRCKLLEDNGGKLARRLSGGGAVFHDLGNLNFTFVMDRKLYDLEKQLKVILDAVRSMGIEAEFSGRNDLVVDGRKFSGNAFYFSAEAAYHHGTILFDSDFGKLVRYLQVSREKIQSKGIESIRSRVVNLKEINPELGLLSLKNALKKSFIDNYGNGTGEAISKDTGRGISKGTSKDAGRGISNLGTKVIDTSQMNELNELYEKYSSWEWRYGNSPEFDITYSERFDWGGIELGFTLKNGVIEEAVIYSDAMESELIGYLSGEFTGKPFKLEQVLGCIDQLGANALMFNEDQSRYKKILDDLRNWLKARDW